MAVLTVPEPNLALDSLVEITSPFIGEDFLKNLTRGLGKLLDAELTFITRALDMPTTKVRVLAAWNTENFMDTWDFDLDGTPCQLVYDGQPVMILKDVKYDFPAERETDFHSFIGIPLHDHQKNIIGHIAIYATHKREFDPKMLSMVQLFGHRAEAEMLRLVLEQERDRAYTELLKLVEQLREDSHTDALTGIYNRRHFMGECLKEWLGLRRYKQPVSLIVADVDHFKSVNDTYGHPVGDLALKHIAKILKKEFRYEIDIVSRIGGEEFSVICSNTKLEGAYIAAERFMKALLETPLILEDGKTLALTCSIGITEGKEQDASWEVMFERADQAMYQAKESGRNQIKMD